MFENVIYIALWPVGIGLIFAIFAFFHDRKRKKQKEKHA